MSTNEQVVLVGGKSATGKSASLRELADQEGVLYLNSEAGKRLPFKTKFLQKTITDPLQVNEAFDWAETQPKIHTIVIDSLTYLLDMFESQFIYNSTDGQKAWGDFAQFFRKLMQEKVAGSTKKVVFTAHTVDTLNATEMIMETKVPVKGATKNNGIESYFGVVIATKKMTLKALEGYKSSLLVITPEEEALGFKYVFQTKVTKDTVNERLRGPIGLFSNAETFIDNDMQLVLDRLKEYYAE